MTFWFQFFVRQHRIRKCGPASGCSLSVNISNRAMEVSQPFGSAGLFWLRNKSVALELCYVIWQRLGSHPQRWPKKDVGTFPVRRMSSDRVAVLAACSHRRASAFARSSSARRLAAASLFISFSFACDLIRSTFTWWDFSSNQYSQPMFNLRFASWNPGHLKGVRL